MRKTDRRGPAAFGRSLWRRRRSAGAGHTCELPEHDDRRDA
jgi:hypothetical protein